jgi:hypothetical protein
MSIILDNILSRKTGERVVFGVPINYSWNDTQKVISWATALVSYQEGIVEFKEAWDNVRKTN